MCISRVELAVVKGGGVMERGEGREGGGGRERGRERERKRERERERERETERERERESTLCLRQCTLSQTGGIHISLECVLLKVAIPPLRSYKPQRQ